MSWHYKRRRKPALAFWLGHDSFTLVIWRRQLSWYAKEVDP